MIILLVLESSFLIRRGKWSSIVSYAADRVIVHEMERLEKNEQDGEVGSHDRLMYISIGY